MNFEKLKNIFLNQEKYVGLFFENNIIKIIELTKKNDDIFPSYYNEINLSLQEIDIETVSIKYLVELFKQIKKNIKTDNISINNIENKKVESDIYSSLKIAGFKTIEKKKLKKGIEKIIINKTQTQNRIIFFLSIKTITLYKIKDSKIIESKTIKYENFTDTIIDEIFSNKWNKNVYVLGGIDNKLQNIEKKLTAKKIQIHIFNIWENLLDFKYQIPKLFLNESHKYLESILIALATNNKVTKNWLFKDAKTTSYKKTKKIDKKKLVIKERYKEIEIQTTNNDVNNIGKEIAVEKQVTKKKLISVPIIFAFLSLETYLILIFTKINIGVALNSRYDCNCFIENNFYILLILTIIFSLSSLIIIIYLFKNKKSNKYIKTIKEKTLLFLPKPKNKLFLKRTTKKIFLPKTKQKLEKKTKKQKKRRKNRKK